jgi:hypothetical protein
MDDWSPQEPEANLHLAAALTLASRFPGTLEPESQELPNPGVIEAGNCDLVVEHGAQVVVIHRVPAGHHDLAGRIPLGKLLDLQRQITAAVGHDFVQAVQEDTQPAGGQSLRHDLLRALHQRPGMRFPAAPPQGTAILDKSKGFDDQLLYRPATKVIASQLNQDRHPVETLRCCGPLQHRMAKHRRLSRARRADDHSAQMTLYVAIAIDPPAALIVLERHIHGVERNRHVLREAELRGLVRPCHPGRIPGPLVAANRSPSTGSVPHPP